MVELTEGVGLIELMVIASKLQPDEIEQYEAFTGLAYDADSFASALFTSPGPKWTLWHENKPIAAAGFHRLRPGVWQDWLASLDEAWSPKCWFQVTRHSRRVMNWMLREHAHRLQCVSLASRIHAHAWYRPLGLELEGVLEGYGANGENALLFSRNRG